MINDRIELLDHGFVRLVDAMGDDLSVVRAARVSYDAAWRAGENEGSDQRLINYLWKNKHTSPFEAVSFTFEVKAPIFVFRQWHRHRTWSYNELSARYKELPEEFYVPDFAQVQAQSTNNKQGREGALDPAIVGASIDAMRSTNAEAFEVYRQMLSAGVARELARSVLPVATYSHMFASVDLLNLLKFFQLRDHSHAQYEIRVYAQAMKQLIEPFVPAVIKAFDLAEV
jgi:thymidylate synthase (FAD)